VAEGTEERDHDQDEAPCGQGCREHRLETIHRTIGCPESRKPLTDQAIDRGERQHPSSSDEEDESACAGHRRGVYRVEAASPGASTVLADPLAQNLLASRAPMR
jgi:hypothetical protein